MANHKKIFLKRINLQKKFFLKNKTNVISREKNIFKNRFFFFNQYLNNYLKNYYFL